MVFCVALAILLVASTASALSYDVRDLRCGVCRAAVNEIKEIVERVGAGKTAKIGSHRIDAEGNLQSRTIPLVHSEGFLLEAMEKACGRMENYARGLDKKTGALRVIKLFTHVDVMNPEMELIQPISDSDMNQSLFMHCDDILDTYEEDIVRAFQPGGDVDRACVRPDDLCRDDARTDL